MPQPSAAAHPNGATASALRICLLGPPRVVWADECLAIRRRQVRALLYYLAAVQQAVPREQLCGLFWADVPEALARRNLTALLTHMRRALPTPELLLAAGDVIELEPGSFWSDTAALARVRTAPRHGDRRRVLQQAIALYGGPFLAGFSLPGCPEYEAWATSERQACERMFLDALDDLIEEQAATGEHEAAIALARRYLEIDDLAEDIHRRLIQLHCATGDRSAALDQYERCALTLERELGVRPLPETEAAYRAAQTGVLPAETRPAARPVTLTFRGLHVPLIGRDQALGRLAEAYARARSGDGRVLLISGEAGVGKSRLVQEFAARLQGSTLVLKGCAHPDTRTMPYQPVVEALRPALLTRRLMGRGQPAWLAEASRLVPELRDVYPSLPAPPAGDPNHTRTTLFEALTQLVLGLAAGSRPVLLCLDDLHWADDTTLTWLAYLGRALPGSRLLVLCIVQSEEAESVAGLRYALARHGVLDELALDRLDQAATSQILWHLADRLPFDPALASRLHRATGGNAFFLLETIRALLESELERAGSPGQNGWKELPLPSTIRGAVEARTERLSPQARQVLAAAAVLGRPFSFDLAHLTAGRRDVETMDALDELVSRQLLRQENGRYWFCHQVTRTAVYRSLSPGRCRLLHKRAAQALEKLRPGDAAALTDHFQRAGEGGRAARYALQAGQAAKAVFGHAEARAYFDRALSLLQHEASSQHDLQALAANHRLQIEALYERGWALRLLGDMEAYARDLEKVASLADLLGDPGTLAHLRWRQAYAHRWFCRYAAAREEAAAGLQLSVAAGDRRLEALCLREIGLAARETGDYGRARELLERALAMLADLGDAQYEIHTLGNLSTLALRQGAPEEALDLARRAMARSEAAHLPLDRRIPLADLGAAAAALGDAALAGQSLLDSLTLARQAADRTQEILCHVHLGWLAARASQPARALEQFEAGLALARQVSSCTEQAQLLAGLAEVHRLLGKIEEARVYAGQALEMARATGRPYDEALARQVLDQLGAG